MQEETSARNNDRGVDASRGVSRVWDVLEQAFYSLKAGAAAGHEQRTAGFQSQRGGAGTDLFVPG